MTTAEGVAATAPWRVELLVTKDIIGTSSQCLSQIYS